MNYPYRIIYHLKLPDSETVTLVCDQESTDPILELGSGIRWNGVEYVVVGRSRPIGDLVYTLDCRLV